MAKLPEPVRLNRAPGPIGIIDPRGSRAAANVGAIAGELGQEASDYFFKVAADEAARKGKEAANAFIFDKDPETGQIIPPQRPNLDGRLVPNIYDQNYHSQLTVRYQQEILITGHKRAHELALENPNNPAAFDAGWQEYKTQTAMSVPKDVRGNVDTALSQMGVPYSNAIAKARAEIDAQLAKNTAFEALEIDANSAAQLIGANASHEEVQAQRDLIDRQLLGLVAIGTLDENDVFAFQQDMERRLSFARISNDFIKLRLNPGKEGGQIALEKMRQQVADGSYKVNISGQPSLIGDMLNEEERRYVSTQLGQYASSAARIESLRERRMLDFMQQNIIMPMLIKGLRNGQAPSEQQMISMLNGASDPAQFNALLSGFNLVQGQVDKRNARYAEHTATGDQIDILRAHAAADPRFAATYEAITGDSLTDVLGLADMLNGNWRSQEAEAFMRGMRSIESSLSDPSDTELKANQALLDWQKRVTDAQKSCEVLSDTGYEQCIAKANSIQLPADLTKSVKDIISEKLRMDALSSLGRDSVDWSSLDPEEIKVQSVVTDAYAKAGHFLPEFAEVMRHAINYDINNTDQIQVKLNLFNIAGKTSEARIGLKQALGEDVYEAYRYLSKAAGSIGLNSPVVKDTAERILDPNTPIDRIFPPQNSEIIESLFSNESKAAEVLSDTAFKTIFGERDNVVFRDTIRAHPVILNEAISKARLFSGAYGIDNMSELIDAALAQAVDSGTAIRSQRVYDQSRSSYLLRQGFVDALGRDIPAEQVVPVGIAPEGSFPEIDDSGVVMYSFDRAGEKLAKEIYPEKEWVSGVNLSYQKVTDTTSSFGKPIYQLIGTDEKGFPVTFGDRGYLDFNPYYEAIKTKKAQNLEQLRDAANARRILQKNPNLTTRMEKQQLDAYIDKLSAEKGAESVVPPDLRRKLNKMDVLKALFGLPYGD